MIDLRRELDQITTPPEGCGLEWLDLEAKLVAELSQRCGHGITIAALWSPSTYEYNCFTFALGVTPDSIRDWSSNSVFFGAAFVQSLITSALSVLELKRDAASTGDLVFYFAAGHPTHAGRLQNGKVVSKWGGHANHIWEHGLFEVPQMYGGQVRFFRAPPPQIVVDSYIAWSKAQECFET